MRGINSQQGIAHILVVMLLLAGIALAVYLVQIRQIYHSQAVSGPISGPIPGDIVPLGSPNGRVDIFDYNQLLSDFGKSGTGLISDIFPPASPDNSVDIFDYNLLLSNFGKHIP